MHTNDPLIPTSQLNAFAKAAQHLAGLAFHQDLWSEAGNILVHSLGADMVAFGQRRDDGQNGTIEMHSWTFSDRSAHGRPPEAHTAKMARDVFDSGLLSVCSLATPEPLAIAVLPIMHEHKVSSVLLVGRMTESPIAKETLDLYLALAGLIGATYTRRRSEEALRESEQRYRRLCQELEERVALRTAQSLKFSKAIEQSPVSVVITDRCGTIQYVNPFFTKITGYSSEEAIGQNPKILNAGRTPRERFKDMWRTILNGQPWYGELINKTRDGRIYVEEVAIAPIRDNRQQITNFVAVKSDITERKRMESDVREAKEEAERLAASLEVKVRARTRELEMRNRELQDFTFIASHDLQEPLRKIQSFGGRLREEYYEFLEDGGRDYIHRMERSAARMQTLIDSLLEYSRVAAKPAPSALVNLGEVAREAMVDIESRIEETAGRIEIGDLPAAEVDVVQMRQVFQNLLSNGLKYHGAEPPLIRVSGETLIEGGRELVRIFVRDNGIGFEEQYRERIFQPFQRLHGRSAFEGTGIGLAIVRRIVERHNGTITATSEPGQSSTFILSLPVKQ